MSPSHGPPYRRRIAVLRPLVLVLVLSAACNTAPPGGDGTADEFWGESSPAIAFTRIRGVPAATDRASTGGVSWADYDGDGDPDLYVTNGYTVSEEPAPKPNRLYRNDNGGLVPIETTPLTADSGYSSGSTWGDYDNDGDPDVFVSNQRGQDNLLFRNEGDGRFTRVEGVAPVQDGGASFASSWVDVDGDGYLDLHVSNGRGAAERDFLYRNRGDGTFERITEGPVVEDSTQSGAPLWADHDGDGDADLFMPDLWDVPYLTNRLYGNEGGWRFTRPSAGPVVTDTLSAFGAAWGDCDNDGRLDLYVAERGAAGRLYINDGRGGFERGPTGPHVLDGGLSGATSWADMDHDGDVDLVVGNWGAAPAVYENLGGCTFRRITAGDLGRERGYASASIAWGDVDGDGDLDLYMGNWPNWEGEGEENFFYRNDGADGHWLEIRLVGTRSNRSAIGARVTAHATIAGEPVVQVRQRAGATTFRSQDAAALHFGLGDAPRVDSLIVRWPSGAVDEFADVRVDRAITITEGNEALARRPAGDPARP